MNKIYQNLLKKQGVLSLDAIIDTEYLSNLKTVAISYGHYILLIPERNYENESRIGYDSENQGVKDQFKVLRYDDNKSRLFAAGLASLVLLEFDEQGMICRSRILQHEKINRTSRYLSWDPSEDVLIMVETINRTTERVNVFRITEGELEYVRSVSDMAMFSAFYNLYGRLLVYQDMNRKNVIKFALNDLLKQDSEFKGEVIYQIPERYQSSGFLKFAIYNKFLAAKLIYDIQDLKK